MKRVITHSLQKSNRPRILNKKAAQKQWEKKNYIIKGQKYLSLEVLGK